MRLLKTTAAALALAMAALSMPVTSDTADAGHRHWHGKKRVVVHHYHGRPYRRWGRPVVVYRDYDPGIGFAAGALGFVAGAVVGSALAQPRVVAPGPYVIEGPVEPDVVYKSGIAPEPYSAEWYAYCDAKYRSFDRQTGTFMGNDGARHLCR
jgi:hypothetical protein